MPTPWGWVVAERQPEGVKEKHKFMYYYDKKLTAYSKELRKNMTDAERKLWYDCLCKLPIRFRRQKSIGNYILDFYCASKQIAIELDGSQHYEKENIDYDNKRTEYLNGLGIVVYRYLDNDVLTNFDGVCNDIMKKLGLI